MSSIARTPRSLVCLLAAALLVAVATRGVALEQVTLALNWKAQPELGGFYQALAAGHYAERGLDVSIRLGGPLVNNRPLLPVGRVDFLVGTNLLQAFDAVKQGIPTRVVAAMLQRDPQCLLAHAGSSYETLAELRAAPLLLGAPGRHSFFLWLEARHGFRRAMLRPYNHSLAPFLARQDWAVQGYATAEPRRVTEAGAPEPRVFLLADNGWLSYSTTIETRQELIDERPELVRAFIDASILGWYEYLYGDPDAANERILRDNRDMTAGQIAYSIDAMRRWGLVDSGDAERRGIGVIDPQRVAEFYRSMVAAGLFGADEINPADAMDSSFAGHGVGLERRAELLADTEGT